MYWLTMAFAVWDDRIKFGDRLILIKRKSTKDEAIMLCHKMDALCIRIENLTAQLENADSQSLSEELTALTTELKKLHDRLSNFRNGKPDNE